MDTLPETPKHYNQKKTGYGQQEEDDDEYGDEDDGGFDEYDENEGVKRLKISHESSDYDQNEFDEP